MIKSTSTSRRHRGFSLMELMVVVAIVGILAAIAYPSYTRHICSVQEGQAQADLVAFAQAMERYYTVNNFTYVGAAAGTVFPNYSPSEGSAANRSYNLAIEASSKNAFSLSATRAGGNCGDGPWTLNSTGTRNWD